MGRTRHSDKIDLAPKETVLKYKHTGKEEDGPSMDLFRPDFSEGLPENSLWNIRLAEIFANDYARNGLPFSQFRDVSKYFLAYLRTLKTAYGKMTTSATSGKGTVYEEASRYNRIRKRKISVRLLSHLLYNYTNMFDQRFENQLSALNYYGLDRFTKHLSDMTYAALSEDESDHEKGTNLGRGRYVIIQEEWRSEELIKWLRMIDLLACGEKWDGRNVARQGNGRRLRVVSTGVRSESKSGVAVSGLPENCYNPYWLKNLTGYERKHLKVKPAIDMTFREEERVCVFQL